MTTELYSMSAYTHAHNNNLLILLLQREEPPDQPTTPLTTGSLGPAPLPAEP